MPESFSNPMELAPTCVEVSPISSGGWWRQVDEAASTTTTPPIANNIKCTIVIDTNSQLSLFPSHCQCISFYQFTV